MTRTMLLAATAIVAFGCTAGVADARPQTTKGPGYLPACFKPWDADTKFMTWKKKDGPYRIAFVNGFVGNTWRIQMIQTAKAFVEQPGIKEHIKEFKTISTGTDAAAQLGAIEDFINQGYDAIIVEAVSPDGFDRVIRMADKENVVLVPFDNALDTDKVMQVNEDQVEMGRLAADWIIKESGKKEGKLLEVRGVPGNSVDRDRHEGFNNELKKQGAKFEVVDVVGNWDDGTAQKAVADALAVHGHFDGVYTQGGSTGTVRAFLDAKKPLVPVAGEAENGFRKLIAEKADDGLKGMSEGQSPALVAISIKAAIAALQGQTMPQMISVPIPKADYTDLKAGENYYPKLSDNFFAVNDFPPCGVTITAPEIMGQTAASNK